MPSRGEVKAKVKEERSQPKPEPQPKRRAGLRSGPAFLVKHDE
jgi:hypothetical protein